MFGELKNPLLYKNIIIPIIGPIPNIKSTNFAEFFVWPSSWFFLFDFFLIFFEFLVFMAIKYYVATLKDVYDF